MRWQRPQPRGSRFEELGTALVPDRAITRFGLAIFAICFVAAVAGNLINSPSAATPPSLVIASMVDRDVELAEHIRHTRGWTGTALRLLFPCSGRWLPLGLQALDREVSRLNEWAELHNLDSLGGLPTDKGSTQRQKVLELRQLQLVVLAETHDWKAFNKQLSQLDDVPEGAALKELLLAAYGFRSDLASPATEAIGGGVTARGWGSRTLLRRLARQESSAAWVRPAGDEALKHAAITRLLLAGPLWIGLALLLLRSLKWTPTEAASGLMGHELWTGLGITVRMGLVLLASLAGVVAIDWSRPGLGSAALVLIASLFSLGGLVAIVQWFDSRLWLRLICCSHRRFVVTAAAGAAAVTAAGLGVLSLIGGEALIAGGPPAYEGAWLVGRSRLDLTWHLAGSAFLVPVIEETTFRGILFPTLRTRTGLWTAAAISSACYTLIHPASIIGMLSLFWCGIVWAWACEWSRSILPALFCHSLFNVAPVVEVLARYR